jgi:two-component system, LytTR family, response regulator
MSYKAVVIDNNARELSQSVELLTQSGAFETVVPFADAKEAIEYIDSQGCDVLFTEILDGFHMAKRYGKSNLTMCLVILTSNESYALEAFRLHATDFALKPIEPYVIERIVNKITNKQYF